METYAIILTFADLKAINAEKMHNREIIKNCHPNPPSKDSGETASKKGTVKNAEKPWMPYFMLPIKW